MQFYLIFRGKEKRLALNGKGGEGYQMQTAHFKMSSLLCPVHTNVLSYDDPHISMRLGILSTR